MILRLFPHRGSPGGGRPEPGLERGEEGSFTAVQRHVVRPVASGTALLERIGLKAGALCSTAARRLATRPRGETMMQQTPGKSPKPSLHGKKTGAPSPQRALAQPLSRWLAPATFKYVWPRARMLDALVPPMCHLGECSLGSVNTRRILLHAMMPRVTSSLCSPPCALSRARTAGKRRWNCV